MRLLEPEMLLEMQKNEMKRHEAWLVYGALLVRYAVTYRHLLVKNRWFYNWRMSVSVAQYNMVVLIIVWITQRAAGQCIYDRLKIFPTFPSPPLHAVWKTNSKVLTSSTCEYFPHYPRKYWSNVHEMSKYHFFNLIIGGTTLLPISSLSLWIVYQICLSFPDLFP